MTTTTSEASIRPKAEVRSTPVGEMFVDVALRERTARHDTMLTQLNKFDFSCMQEKVTRLESDVANLIKFKDSFLIKLAWWALGSTVAICGFVIGVALRYAEPIGNLLRSLEQLTPKT